MGTLRISAAAMLVCTGAAASATAQPSIGSMETASMSLRVANDSGQSDFINSGGEVPVRRSGSSFTNLGENRFGGSIEGTWNEELVGSDRFITLVYRSTTGSPFVPFGAQLNGQDATSYTWRFGMTDPVAFLPAFTNVTLLGVRLSLSSDLGASESFSAAIPVTSYPTHTDWRPASDMGMTLGTVGDGTNWLRLEYRIRAIPTPGALAAVGLAGLLASRRRRSA